MEDEELEPRVKQVWEICSLVRDNIASKINKEYTFKRYRSAHPIAFSGPDSIKYFQQNLFKRLAEVFDNLAWVSQHEQVRQAAVAEFRLYESIYTQIVSYYPKDFLPQRLIASFQAAKAQIEGS